MAEEKKSGWGTVTTRVEPNNLVIAGYPLAQLIEKSNVLETAHLLIKTELPTKEELAAHTKSAYKAAMMPAPQVARFEGEDISAALGKSLLMDKALFEVPTAGDDGPVNKTIFALGRFCRYLANLLGNEAALDKASDTEPFGNLIYRAVTGEASVDPKRGLMIETMVVASVDHGVTPPSAQAGMIAASVRADYAMSLCSGVGAITDVHGGAGRMAALFFMKVVDRAKAEDISLEKACEALVREYKENKKRIQGLGHRVHSQDPRRDILWQRSKEYGLASDYVAVSEMITDIFKNISGKNLPINVDGVIGAVVADMGVDVDLAKALFVFGRVAGLSAHYFEEISTQRPMRRINFGDAVYEGKPDRNYPA
ncbi:MAG: citrate/2-methylcitrate synthase [Myxococcota bacterium]|nr:citrate/2-methylcitrate synthase [Myxococcota bacterium]